MMFIVSRRRPAIVLHFSWGRLIAPGTWPFLKSLDSRTSMMTMSSPFSIWWLISTGPVVKAILSAKNCFALAALLLIVLVIMLVCFLVLAGIISCLWFEELTAPEAPPTETDSSWPGRRGLFQTYQNA